MTTVMLGRIKTILSMMVLITDGHGRVTHHEVSSRVLQMKPTVVTESNRPQIEKHVMTETLSREIDVLIAVNSKRLRDRLLLILSRKSHETHGYLPVPSIVE
jgi:hypothetical protein